MKITCKRCGYIDGEHFFSFSCTKKIIYPHRICLMCVQEEKDKLKRPNRALPKARNIIYTHCQRYNHKNNTTLTPIEFARKFGWDLTQMTHDIEHAFNNWCSYCESPYSSMSHGLADVTLDIINPSDPPYYTNIRYCCGTCNRRKGQLGATSFGKFLASVKRRRQFLESHFGSELKPQYILPLNSNGGESKGD